MSIPITLFETACKESCLPPAPGCIPVEKAFTSVVNRYALLTRIAKEIVPKDLLRRFMCEFRLPCPQGCTDHRLSIHPRCARDSIADPERLCISPAGTAGQSQKYQLFFEIRPCRFPYGRSSQQRDPHVSPNMQCPVLRR